MTCILCSALHAVPDCPHCREDACEDARDAALRCFRRAMRRHERRARRMGLRHTANRIRTLRLYDVENAEAQCRKHARWAVGSDVSFGLPPAEDMARPTYAFLMLLAADAVSRLRAALAEADRAETSPRTYYAPHAIVTIGSAPVPVMDLTYRTDDA